MNILKIFRLSLVLMILLLTQAKSLTLSVLANLLEKNLSSISRYQCLITDSTIQTNSGELCVSTINADINLNSSVRLLFTNNQYRYHSFEATKSDDTLSLTWKMDSIQYYNSQVQYLTATYLQDSVGKSIISQHWLALRQLDSMGYIDFERLVSDMAKIKPAQGYPLIDEWLPNTPRIWDSIKINDFIGVTTYEVTNSLIKILRDPNIQKYYTDPDSLYKVGAINDSVYMILRNAVPITINNNNKICIYYVDPSDSIVKKYSEQSSEYKKQITFSKAQYWRLMTNLMHPENSLKTIKDIIVTENNAILKILFPSSVFRNITIYTISGRQIFKTITTENVFQLPKMNIANGCGRYIVRVIEGNTVFVKLYSVK